MVEVEIVKTYVVTLDETEAKMLLETLLKSSDLLELRQQLINVLR